MSSTSLEIIKKTDTDEEIKEPPLYKIIMLNDHYTTMDFVILVLEKIFKKDKEEAFGNSVNDSEPNTMDMDAAIPDGNDLHKQKKGFRAAAGGDNPMNTERTDLRAQIRAELLQRLAEAKGAK